MKIKERTYKVCKITIREVSTWRKEGIVDTKISNFWNVDIEHSLGSTLFRVDSKTELLRMLKQELSMVRVKP